VNADQHREHWTDHLKSWLSYEVLDEKGVTVNRLNDMHYYNTSFIGGTEKHIKQLNYFGDIDLELSMLSSMYKKEDVSKYLYFSDTGEDKIGYDNETIFTIKAIESGVNIQPMSKDFSSFTHVYRKKRFGDYL
jgi:vancomycin permeability regulator SanA